MIREDTLDGAIAEATAHAVTTVRYLTEIDWEQADEHVRGGLRAFFAAFASAGMTLVPTDPTEEMVDAALYQLPEDSDDSQAQLVLMAMASRAGEMFDSTFEIGSKSTDAGSALEAGLHAMIDELSGRTVDLYETSGVAKAAVVTFLSSLANDGIVPAPFSPTAEMMEKGLYHASEEATFDAVHSAYVDAVHGLSNELDLTFSDPVDGPEYPTEADPANHAGP
jgi:hypothetical protein